MNDIKTCVLWSVSMTLSGNQSNNTRMMLGWQAAEDGPQKRQEQRPRSDGSTTKPSRPSTAGSVVRVAEERSR